jgi:septum formation topological specificity factor MinE
MPHIFIDACNTEKTMRQIIAHVRVDFSEEYYKNYRLQADRKLKDLQSELCAVITKYFEANECDSDIMTNREYDLKINDHS